MLLSRDYLFIALVCFRFLVCVRQTVRGKFWADVSRQLDRVMLSFVFCYVRFCLFGCTCIGPRAKGVQWVQLNSSPTDPHVNQNQETLHKKCHHRMRFLSSECVVILCLALYSLGWACSPPQSPNWINGGPWVESNPLWKSPAMGLCMVSVVYRG